MTFVSSQARSSLQSAPTSRHTGNWELCLQPISREGLASASPFCSRAPGPAALHRGHVLSQFPPRPPATGPKPPECNRKLPCRLVFKHLHNGVKITTVFSHTYVLMPCLSTLLSTLAQNRGVGVHHRPQVIARFFKHLHYNLKITTVFSDTCVFEALSKYFAFHTCIKQGGRGRATAHRP